MKTDHIAFGVVNEGDESVFSDGELFLEDSAAVLGGAGGFDCAIGAAEIDDHAVTLWAVTAGHFDESASATWKITRHGKGEHLDGRAAEVLEFYFKDFLVEGLRTGEVIDIDLEPTDCKALRSHGWML
jgi:hypothetical protein